MGQLCCKTKQGADSEAHEIEAAAPLPAGQADLKNTTDKKDKDTKLILKRYQMNTGKDSIMGEGTSSVCRKGVDTSSNVQVAIKTYKTGKDAKDGGQRALNVRNTKFKRQIEVLQHLQEPFQKPAEDIYWCTNLKNAQPKRLFMVLLDYTKNENGEPGLPSKSPDETLYVVTELAQYSLKDYLALRRDQNRPLPKESVKNITKAIILVVAGLHAKKYVHLDLKPENLMMFNGRLKLIDVDGCVQAGTKISISDSSISFSPCYCAPEWAKFLIEDSQSKIDVEPHLDVWSIGMTLCELVTLDAVLKPMYATFLRNGHSHREAGFLFMDWLSHIKKVPLPQSIQKFAPEQDKPGFNDLIVNWLLVCDVEKRKTLAQCFSEGHDYLAPGTTGNKKGGDPAKQDSDPNRDGIEQHLAIKDEPGDSRKNQEAAMNALKQRKDAAKRMFDESDTQVFKGKLWKLNSNGDPQDDSCWLERDMYIAGNYSFCYYSVRNDAKMVLFDAAKLQGAKIGRVEKLPPKLEWAFYIDTRPFFDEQEQEQGGNEEEEAVAYDKTCFGCSSKADYIQWMNILKSAAQMDAMPKWSTQDVAANQKFLVTVKNRRLKLKDGEKEERFERKLWKLKAEGDYRNYDHWFERTMWISKKGCLCYKSVRQEGEELVYYSPEDLQTAKMLRLQDEYGKVEETLKFRDKDVEIIMHPFTIMLAPKSGTHFAAGCFAAQSRADLDAWKRDFDEAGRRGARGSETSNPARGD